MKISDVRNIRKYNKNSNKNDEMITVINNMILLNWKIGIKRNVNNKITHFFFIPSSSLFL
jgi:hypothetical protein